MASRSKDSRPPRPPATTPEARENQLIALAVDVAEQQMLTGKASSQVIVHYLKLASSRERLEQKKITNENELLAAKVKGLASAERVEELYEKAIKAMRTYAGHPEEVFEDEDLHRT